MYISHCPPKSRIAPAVLTLFLLSTVGYGADVSTVDPIVWQLPAGNPGTALGPTGAGTRMIWYPKKGAFRMGTISGTPNDQWIDEAIGMQSFGAGSNVKASGAAAAAFGSGSTASGPSAIAAGSATIASGLWSAAFGSGTQAIGYYAPFASGWNSKASGMAAHAICFTTHASGNYALAAGSNTLASGEASTAMGISTTASSFGSVVIGRFNAMPAVVSATNWVGTDPLFVIGNGVPPAGQTAAIPKNAFIVTKNGDAGVQGVLRVWPAGDIGMGDFRNGTEPPPKHLP